MRKIVISSQTEKATEARQHCHNSIKIIEEKKEEQAEHGFAVCGMFFKSIF